MSMKQFNVGIKAVIVQDNKVLLLRKASDNPFWELPGGRINDNESIVDALTRELTEELPNILNIKIGEIVDAHRLSKDIKPDLGLVLIFYKVSAEFEGDPQISEEHDQYKWLTKEEALTLADEASHTAVTIALGGSITSKST